MIDKFENDKLFYQDEDVVIVLDGIILNKSDLIKEGKNEDWSEFVKNLYYDVGEEFFSSFRGSFAGALLDKKLNKWIVFGDQLGTKFIYYTLKDDKFVCSQMMTNQYTMLKENGIEYKLDRTGAYYLLSFGFMLEDQTICSEIKKIQPGCYIVYENGVVTEKRYYMLDNTPDNSLSEDAAIELIDKYFRQAVDREYRKDDEYGYRHICSLSGGLDCRMTTIVAHDLGYTDQLNITFSQTDYYDQTIPQKIAEDLKHEWLFKSLDNGTWLYDIDKTTRVTGGNVIYSGTAHGDSLYKYMDFSKLGILHSGQIGDSIIATHYTEERMSLPFKVTDVAYSKRLFQKFNVLPKMALPNGEIGFFYYRALNGTNNGQQNEYNYTESYSPFFDLDFLENVLSIPVKFRQYHYIYKKWIMKKYPHASNYIWEHLGTKIQAKTMVIKGHDVAIKKIPKIILRKYVTKSYSISGKNNMNPVAYYLKTNGQLSAIIDSYFEYASKIEDEDLRKEISFIHEAGTPMEKIQAVSLLSALKLYY